jgi:hypothetical protein
MPAICQQSHGAENVTGSYFYNHHREGQQDNPSGIVFGMAVFNVKPVAVLPEVQVVTVHGVIDSQLLIGNSFELISK